jgi:hypothetical protein
MRRDKILRSAIQVLDDRESRYGNPSDCLSRIAAGWNWWLKSRRELTEVDVAVMMMILKLSRLANDPTSLDSWIDACGYSAIGGELNGGRND